VGRLPSVAPRAALILLLASSCDDGRAHAPALAPSARAEIVHATGPAPAATTAPSAALPKTARAARKLCEGQLSKPGRDLPRHKPSRMAAPGEMGGPGPLATGSGRWTWINLWAAWCQPCKNEIPLLRAFANRLEKAGKPMDIVFVSLDDDERQLEQFLREQPSAGLRSTYWLREGRERVEWLADVGVPATQELPVQIWVDPRGKVRCVAEGAIVENDYPEVEKLAVDGSPR
jgi:thiol-disulfide isomerase/thioredoxin